MWKSFSTILRQFYLAYLKSKLPQNSGSNYIYYTEMQCDFIVLFYEIKGHTHLSIHLHWCDAAHFKTLQNFRPNWYQIAKCRMINIYSDAIYKQNFMFAFIFLIKIIIQNVTVQLLYNSMYVHVYILLYHLRIGTFECILQLLLLFYSFSVLKKSSRLHSNRLFVQNFFRVGVLPNINLCNNRILDGTQWVNLCRW